MATQVQIAWKWIEINTNTTKAQIKKLLKEHGIKDDDLTRAVYVIRAKDVFAIEYPLGVSPTLYIGEGKFFQRIDIHRKWIKQIFEQKILFPLEIAVATPRVKHNAVAYKELEAFLLHEFETNFGSLPMNNKNHETIKFGHKYDSSEINSVIGLGRGKRYKWAIKPMKSNAFHSLFHRTHTK